MGFWLLMLLLDLLTPLILIILGMRFMKKAPKEISWIYGYKTTMSMKNKETWDFAHQYWGQTAKCVGWVYMNGRNSKLSFR